MVTHLLLRQGQLKVIAVYQSRLHSLDYKQILTKVGAIAEL
jgi:hypothetical protein